MSERRLEEALRTLKYYADRQGHDGNWNLALAAEAEMTERLAAAREEGRREGFDRARDMAVGVVRDMLEWQGPTPVGDRIRAMRDGTGETGTSGDPMCRCGYRKSEHDARGQVIATTKRDGTPRARPSVACIGFREAP